MSPRAVPPKVANRAEVPALRGLHVGGDIVEVGLFERAELLEVVGGVKVLGVEVILADDGVEEVEAFGHAAGGRSGDVALGVDEDVAVFSFSGVEFAADKDGEAVERPGLPILIFKAEHGFAAGDGP